MEEPTDTFHFLSKCITVKKLESLVVILNILEGHGFTWESNKPYGHSFHVNSQSSICYNFEGFYDPLELTHEPDIQNL